MTKILGDLRFFMAVSIDKHMGCSDLGCDLVGLAKIELKFHRTFAKTKDTQFNLKLFAGKQRRLVVGLCMNKGNAMNRVLEPLAPLNSLIFYKMFKASVGLGVDLCKKLNAGQVCLVKVNPCVPSEAH